MTSLNLEAEGHSPRDMSESQMSQLWG